MPAVAIRGGGAVLSFSLSSIDALPRGVTSRRGALAFRT